MSNNNLAGFPAFGPRVDTKITYAPQSHAYETPPALPNGAPTEATYSWTITSAMMPTFSPYAIPYSPRAYIHAIVYNNSGGVASNVTMRYRLNGGTWTAAGGDSSLAAGKYDSFVKIVDGIAVGDVLDVQLYTVASANAPVLNWVGLAIAPYSILSGQGSVANLEVDVSSACWYSGMTARLSTSSKVLLSYGRAVTYGTSEFTSSFAFRAYDPFDGFGITIKAYDVVYENTGATVVNQPYYPTRIAYTPIL